MSEVAGGAEPAPAKAPEPVKVVDPAAAPAAPADPAKPAEPEDEGGLDPQLVGLALVLWALAIGILVVKFPRLRVDWYLGNIKEASAELRVDDASVSALVDLATSDPATLTALGEEVSGPLANRDEIYRSVVVRAIGRVPGPASLDLLLQSAGDYHGLVRGNVYVVLGQRALNVPAERAAIEPVLLNAIGQPGEGEPVGRAVAIDALAKLGSKAAIWPTIVSLREARHDGPINEEDPMATGQLRLRTQAIAALRELAKKTEAELPFDPRAPLATRDQQVRALEAWYVGQGGAIPQGEGFDEAAAKRASVAPVETQTAPQGPRQGGQ